MNFADWNLGASGQGCDDLETDDKVLLQFFPATIVGSCDAELETLPCDGKGGIVGVQVLTSHNVQGDRRRFLFDFGRGILFDDGSRRVIASVVVIGSGSLPRHGDDLDGIALDGLCS